MPVKRPARRLGPGRLSAEDAAQLPDRLLDAAYELFSDRGFADTTMDQIAKRAGASTKTLYSRYENKADILAAVVRRIVDQTVAGHEEIAALQSLADDPRGFLVSFCVQVAVRISTEAAGLNRLAVAEGHRYSELRRRIARPSAAAPASSARISSAGGRRVGCRTFPKPSARPPYASAWRPTRCASAPRSAIRPAGPRSRPMWAMRSTCSCAAAASMRGGA
jgi:AcrR family transcriptional regulator